MSDWLFDDVGWLIAWIYSWSNDYSIAIGAMAVVAMIVITPLTLKSTRGMLETQRLQPELRRLQIEHKGDRQGLNEAMMNLYQGHKVSPLASCLPLLAQMPVFILMLRLLTGLTYRPSTGAGFAPKHLSDTSEMYLSLVGKQEMRSIGLDLAVQPINVMRDDFARGLIYAGLIVALALVYLLQQRMVASRTVSPTMSASQQKIMQYLPVAFAVFQAMLPTGLVVYYFVQAVVRIGQQAYITKRFYGNDDSIGRQAQQVSTKAREMKDDDKKTKKTEKTGQNEQFPSKHTRETVTVESVPWGHQNVAVRHSRWSQNPHISMSYSYLREGGKPEDREKITESENDLHLAGEACSRRWPGSMHGAWLSGEQAAGNCLQKRRVMIIGAGIAGIAAARHLREAGVEAFILEAGQLAFGRAGGRESRFIEGGMWLHGGDNHPLKPHLAAAGIVMLESRRPIKEDDPGDYGADTWQGGAKLEETRHQRLRDKALEIENKFDRVEQGAGGVDNLADLIENELQEHLEEDREVLRGWLHTLYKTIVGADLENLSRKHRFEPFALEGPDLMLTEHVARVDHLIEGLEIVYGSDVVELRYEGQTWVARDKTGRTYDADAVICTAPIAVLGRIDIKPPFSAGKREALSRIGAGKVEKIWLTFENRCWAETTHFHIADDTALARLFIDVSEAVGKPTLMGFIDHDKVEHMRGKSGGELAEKILDDLKRAGVIDEPNRTKRGDQP